MTARKGRCQFRGRSKKVGLPLDSKPPGKLAVAVGGAPGRAVTEAAIRRTWWRQEVCGFAAVESWVAAGGSGWFTAVGCQGGRGDGFAAALPKGAPEEQGGSVAVPEG
ncbi:hypothetical protein MLD38_036109 [Melastoma candidum]|uniref:Uncharacterized protein n=1 Tax=Melastoma candidum TaxID=119954 RepID=A0ACB9LIW0_9MYRT|nr:hypothetical protein MLD38_036109 [Melastoma candidum]